MHLSKQGNHIIITLSLCLIAMGLFVSALQFFVLTLPKQTQKPPVVDGIVVATGGQARLEEGLQLLANKTAPLLLLTGVGEGITKEMIAQSLVLTGDQDKILSCCVTLEFQALDTPGNAIAAKNWSQTNDIQTLLLVTSDYHMPRAALEFTTAMPDRQIIAHPIIAPDLKGKSWYSDWQIARLYSREFLKYSFRRIQLIF